MIALRLIGWCGVVVAALAVPASTAAASNIIRNPDFSGAKGTILPEWSLHKPADQSEAAEGAVGQDEGGRMLVLRKTTDKKDAHFWWKQELAGQGGDSYRIRYEAKAFAADNSGGDYNAYVGIEILDANRKWLGFKTLQTIARHSTAWPGVSRPAVSTWTGFDGEFTLPPGASLFDLRLALGATGASEAAFRNIVIEKTSMSVVDALTALPEQVPIFTIDKSPVSANGVTLTPDWTLDGAQIERSSTRVRLCLNALWAIQPSISDGPTRQVTAPRTDDWAFFKVPGYWSRRLYSVYGQAKTTWLGRDLFSGVEGIWYVRDVVIPTPAEDPNGDVFFELGGMWGYALRVYWNGRAIGEITDQLGGRLRLPAEARPGQSGQLAIYALKVQPNGSAAWMSDFVRRYQAGAGHSDWANGFHDLFLTVEPRASFVSGVKILTSVKEKTLTLRIPAHIHAKDLSASYTWKPMKIGGGGWVTGLDISPTEKGLVYVRTDVSGAYRWNAATSSWKQIVTPASMPAGVLSYGNYGGVDSLVSAPKDPNIAYLAFTAKSYGGADGQIYRSTNHGDTWTATDFLRHKVKMEPNGEGRQEGERLAVDPANSDMVYFGSIENGLWTTSDAGKTWSQVAGIPAGTPGHGVNTVVFDRASGTTQSKTNVIYVTVMDGGVFKTSDAGKTWRPISAQGPGLAGKPRDSAIGPDRTYYVVYDNENGATGSVWKYSPAGLWTDITPPAPNGGNKAWWAVAVNPADAKHVVAMINGGQCFVSSDQGATWSHHGFTLKSPVVEWQEKQSNYYLSVGELAFDPFQSGTLWFAEGFGVWHAKIPPATADVEWHSASPGIEEMCGNDVIAPPAGQPVAAMWDLGAFYFTDVDAYTAQKSHPGFMSAWALDWCPADPKFIVGVFRSHLDFVKKANSSGYSTDGGRTWTRFAALENDTAPKDLEYGVIAVSARDPDNIVWSPSAGALPYYSKDRGATWTRCSLDGATQTGQHSHYAALKPLCADRVQPGTFYLYTPQDGLLRSTDGGAHFSKVGSPLANRWGLFLKSTPGRAGHLWFADGAGGGLWRSTDGGATWTENPGIQQAINIGLGKARTSTGYPTLFVAGIKDGQHGIYRSTDEGKTWDRIGDYPRGITDWIDAMDGDKDIFGQVYVAFAGAGFTYGSPAAK